MRATAVTLTAFALTCLTGAQCAFLRTDKTVTPAPGGPMEERPAADFVAYLNRQAGALKSLRYDKVSVSASGPDGSFRLRSGLIVCAKPRNFRMYGDHFFQGEAFTAGSNDQEFWITVHPPGQSQSLMYCSHEDFARGKVNLPIPFEPDWVLQALGMKDDYDPTAPYTVDKGRDAKTPTYTLSWEARSPQGEPVRKAVEFAANKASGDRPQVVRHIIQDANRTLIASATVQRVEPVVVAGGEVQVPTRVVLEWPQQKYTMDLTLGEVKANETLSAQEMATYFTREEIKGVKPINLATVRFQPSNYRGATPGTAAKPRTFGGR